MMRAKQRQGVKLSYKIASEIKQPNFVLIHNAGGNHQFLKEQFAHLKQLGQVLSVDLRGHGESDKPKQDYTVESFADDVAYLCHEHEIQKAIFIGLNYGANIAIELANKTPELVSHLILIDPPILMEPWVVQLIQEHIDDLNNPELKSFAKNLVEAVFFKTTADNKRLATLAFETTTRHALASTYENLLQWDKTSKNKIAYCKMPVLYIQSREPFCPEDTLRKYCPRLVVGKVVGAGHWATLEVPNQVNAMIERFLEMS